MYYIIICARKVLWIVCLAYSPCLHDYIYPIVYSVHEYRYVVSSGSVIWMRYAFLYNVCCSLYWMISKHKSWIESVVVVGWFFVFLSFSFTFFSLFFAHTFSLSLAVCCWVFYALHKCSTTWYMLRHVSALLFPSFNKSIW